MLTNKSNMDKLEMTNKRALRFVTNKGHLSYDDICKQEKQLNVHRNSLKNVATMMYKVKAGTVPSYIGELFSNSISQYDMRDNERLNLPRFNTVQYGKNSLQYLGAKLWNNIPISIKRSSSLNTFKSAITKWLYTCDLSLIY